MKKIWLPIIAAGMLVTACGSEKSEEGTEKEKTTEKPAENEAPAPEDTETEEESGMSEQAINDRVAEIDDLRNNAEATAKSAEEHQQGPYGLHRSQYMGSSCFLSVRSSFC